MARDSAKKPSDKTRPDDATISTPADEDAGSSAEPQKKPWSRRAVTVGSAAAALGGLTGASTAPPPATPGEQAASGEAEVPAEFRIADTWDIEATRNEEVDFFIDFLTWKNREKTKVWLERLSHYGPMIQQKLSERGMPSDLIWLATIESGLDPNAYSRADAAGLWQFIEETGKRYGLEVSEYVDERRDPVAATDAALDYLKKMNDRFGGSWYLAAAGYNTGENRVERIVNEKAGGKFGDESVYWDISKHLPSETRDYVPLMLAMGHIGKNPAQYGFNDLEPQAPYVFDELKIEPDVPLARVAEKIGVDPQVLFDLNPHLVKKQTPPDREWNVRVPQGTASKFTGL